MNTLDIFHLIQLLAVANNAASGSSKTRLTREDEARWKELLSSASNGDEQAYHQLLSEIAEYLNVFCRRYLYSPTLVEDCIQNCLLAIHRSKHTYNQEKPFGPWFFTLVKNKIFDELRTIKKRNEREMQHNDLSELSAVADTTIDYEGALMGYLAQLDKSQSEVFILSKLKGKSIKEIASLLEISEAAAKVRIHRASKQIKKLINDDFTELTAAG